MTITINGSGTITGAATLATTVASPTFTTPNINSAQVATVTGTAPIYFCRAWVNFNGSGTVAIRASGNVTSITDNGTGDYTVNFATTMPDANYVVCGSSGQSPNQSAIFSKSDQAVQTASAVRIVSISPNVALVDSTYIQCAIFR